MEAYLQSTSVLEVLLASCRDTLAQGILSVRLYTTCSQCYVVEDWQRTVTMRNQLRYSSVISCLGNATVNILLLLNQFPILSQPLEGN